MLFVRTNHEQSQGRPCKRSIHSRSFMDLATSSSARSKALFLVNGVDALVARQGAVKPIVIEKEEVDIKIVR